MSTTGVHLVNYSPPKQGVLAAKDSIMRFGSLFSGIGGLDLGLERAGMRCAWQVEIDEYCLRVLEKHWPDVRRYRDVRECGAHNLQPVDLICGGFPCQPWSVAGKRLGVRDDRNLWPEMLRIIKELRPMWVLGENVPGIGRYLDTICDDLEAVGYEVLPLEIPAAAFGAPHLRYRVFFIGRLAADTDGEGLTHGEGRTGQTGETGRTEPAAHVDERQVEYTWPPEPQVGRVVHGLPRGVDRLARRRVAALGNAVVPQVAEWLGRRLMESMSSVK